MQALELSQKSVSKCDVLKEKKNKQQKTIHPDSVRLGNVRLAPQPSGT